MISIRLHVNNLMRDKDSLTRDEHLEQHSIWSRVLSFHLDAAGRRASHTTTPARLVHGPSCFIPVLTRRFYQTRQPLLSPSLALALPTHPASLAVRRLRQRSGSSQPALLRPWPRRPFPALPSPSHCRVHLGRCAPPEAAAFQRGLWAASRPSPPR